MNIYEYKHVVIEGGLQEFLDRINKEGAEGWRVSSGGLRETDNGTHNYSVIMERAKDKTDVDIRAILSELNNAAIAAYLDESEGKTHA